MVTLLVSDIHLGSDLSRADALLQLLKRGGFDRLILLGDIFSDLNLARLKKEHFQLLNYIRKLSNPKRSVEVVWIEGNHDAGLVAILSHLVGVKAYEEYVWEWNGLTCIAIHGHQFDNIISKNKLLSKVVSFVFLELQKITFLRRSLCIWLDRISASWQRLTPKVANGALEHARNRKAHVIFCGHTHEQYQEERDGVRYYNTGCWVEEACGYILMTEDNIEMCSILAG